MSEIGEKILKRRNDKGLLLREVAALSGVHSSHIARIERGERFPSAKILMKLAKPLNFAEIELLVWAGYVPAHGFEEYRQHLRDELKGEVKKSMLSLEAKIDNILGE